MATNRTNVYSPSEFLERQSGDACMLPLTVVGVSKPGADKNYILFALDVARDVWINVPIALVENVEVLGDAKCGADSYPHVRLRMKEPSSPEGQAFVAFFKGMETALFAVMRKVTPILQAAGEAGLRDACHDCIHACTLIVLPPDDPFAQITCMLNCSACP
ncbi:MAG: hypothetical protein ACR65T_14175 [Methylocystis sp.]|uniref:hypothetical protein n=1 Tax=Methylocystis sp. TaxID=1911079 RepID=UPI003DA632B2